MRRLISLCKRRELMTFFSPSFITWIWMKTGGNLLTAVLLHASINTDGLFVPASSLSSLIAAIITFTILIAIIVANRMWKIETITQNHRNSQGAHIDESGIIK